MVKPWELDWSAGAPPPDAMPLPIMPFFGGLRPPMLDEGGVATDPAAVAAAGLYGMSPALDSGGPPTGLVTGPSAGPYGMAAADPLAMQGTGPLPGDAADPSAMPAVGGPAGMDGPPFMQPAVYDDWAALAAQRGLSSGQGQANGAPIPPLDSGQAPLMLAQDVLRTNGFPDAPPRPVPPSHSKGGPGPGSEEYKASQPSDFLRTYGLGAIPPPQPRNVPQRRVPARQQPAPNPFSAENLKLGPNAQYRNDIVTAAQPGPLTPEGLAALLGGEAIPLHSGLWNPNSANRNTGADGMAQFKFDTWLQEAHRQGGYLNGVARDLGWLDPHGRVARAHQREFLNLRRDPHHAIFAAADYARHNLAVLGDHGLILDRSPAAMAWYAYLAHHEGLQGAADMLRGTRRVTTAMWNENVPAAEQRYWLAANGNNISPAYRAWFVHYASQKANALNYMDDSRNVTVPAAEALYQRPQPQHRQSH
ncbi:MAG: peptidoglycan-binding protein [Alphaproteobacteria bacterium]|nr:peptidoglycan-binding protein [Alphaproteobacteria bacterium]